MSTIALNMTSFDLQYIFFSQAKFIYMTVMSANIVGNVRDQQGYRLILVYSGQCRLQLRQAQRDRNGIPTATKSKLLAIYHKD